jgi:hypothetical protein
MVATRSISKSSSFSGGGCGMVILGLFGLVFGAVGFGTIYYTAGRPLYYLLRAQSWRPAECEILFSQVESSGSKGDTSRISMQYRYTVNDRPYTGKRYDFLVGSDNMDNAGKAEIVAAHRPGQTVACFVDPADPTESVINREFRWKYLMGAAFGAPFALVPVLFISLAVWARRKAQQRQAVQMATTGLPMTGLPASGLMPTTTTFGSSGGPVVLKPESSRLARLAGMIFLCVFWNGIVGLFTYFEITGNIKGANWFIYVFLIPFQVIGLLLLWGVINSALALLNPKPTLTLGADSVPVGGSLTLQWQMSGMVSRLRNLKIVLSGREEAHYRRGTSSYTDKNTFYEVQIAEANDSTRIERGMATISIPRNTMHSFIADDNKIIWSLKVTGEIGFFPDVDETFDILVRPQ